MRKSTCQKESDAKGKRGIRGDAPVTRPQKEDRSYGHRAAEWQPFNTPQRVLTKVSLILTQSGQQAMMSQWMASIAPRAAGPRFF